MRDYALETTFDLKFTTRKFSTGAPFALASGVISAYPDNSITQITAGITLTADFDTVTGLNNVRVVATAANGYASGVNYALVITTGTVDSVSVVGEVIGEFSIEAQSPLRPTTAGRKLDVSAGGEAGLDWANIGSPTTAQNLSATNIDVDQIVASVSGAVGSVTGAVGSVTGAVGSVAGAVGSVTGAVGSVAAGGITAASFAADAITAAKLAADVTTELQSGLATAASIAALNNISAAQVKTQVVDALATDTYAEPAQGAPGATISLAAKVNFLYKAWRNKHTQTATTYSLFNDDAATVDHKATVSDDATTFTRGEAATGP